MSSLTTPTWNIKYFRKHKFARISPKMVNSSSKMSNKIWKDAHERVERPPRNPIKIGSGVCAWQVSDQFSKFENDDIWNVDYKRTTEQKRKWKTGRWSVNQTDPNEHLKYWKSSVWKFPERKIFFENTSRRQRFVWIIQKRRNLV